MRYLYPSFIRSIENSHLINRGDTVILAFSGGKDSVTLLLLLRELRRDLEFKLVAAYFNHHIRDDAPAEEQWVKNFCATHQIDLKVGGGQVTEYKNRHRLNLENAASILRTQFLEKVASRYGNAKIATAHTKSDLTETFFIKLLRGSGTRGLSAVFPQKGNKIVRPLLEFSQKEILAFLERNQIAYYLDYSNEQEQFLRNRIRRRLLPAMEEIAPGLEDHIYKTAQIAQDEYAYFKALAASILGKSLVLDKILPVKALQGHHRALQRHIAREYIAHLKGDLLNIEFRHVEDILESIGGGDGLSIPGLELRLHKYFIFPAELHIPGCGYKIHDLGRTEVKEIAQTLEITKQPSFTKPAHNREIVVPYSNVVFPLTLRSPQKEDRYQKINSPFRQKVFEAIRSAGFPPQLRNLCPVLQDAEGQIIWVINAPVSGAFKVDPQSPGPFLKIALSPR